MSMNSVNTNIGAMVALQSLNRTNDDMAVVQKRISTGLRVSDAKDDGAAFAVAQRIRGDVAGLNTANEQLGSAKGLLNTTMGALNEASKTMINIKETLVKLSSDSISANDRETYTKDFENLVNRMNRALGDASYNGRSLLGSQDSNKSAASTAVSTSVVRNESGATLDMTGVDASTLTFDTRVATKGRDVAGTFTEPTAFALAATTLSAGAARAMLGNGDATGAAGTPLNDLVAAKTDNANFGGAAAAADMKSFATVEAAINGALAKFGSDSRGLDTAMSTNRTKMDSMETGLGALVDADLAKESAKLQSLQIRQQLGTQSLSIANQAPQALLSLFR
jgi:flagellin